MAVVEDLHDVAQILSEFVSHELGFSDVQAGDPRRASASTTPSVRFTLLYVTPQPSHRNDPWQRNPDGTARPPPLSLSCVYLVTTAGADDDDPVAAHNALGRVMQLFHDHEQLDLPLTGGGVSSGLGEGPLGVVQVPLSLELVDKVWSSFEQKLQPWTLLEVSPVQLPSLLPPAAAAAWVRPGGVRLGPVRAGQRPVIARITPSPALAGGRIRVEVASAGLDALAVAGVEVEPGSALRELRRGVWTLALEQGALGTLGEGDHPIAVRSGGIWSRTVPLRIAPAGSPIVHAPEVARHDPSSDLVLSGENLGGAAEALIWPDEGVATPSDVHSVAVTNVSARSLTIPAVASPVGLLDLDHPGGELRVAVRVGAQVFTPYVVLELGA